MPPANSTTRQKNTITHTYMLTYSTHCTVLIFIVFIYCIILREINGCREIKTSNRGSLLHPRGNEVTKKFRTPPPLTNIYTWMDEEEALEFMPRHSLSKINRGENTGIPCASTPQRQVYSLNRQIASNFVGYTNQLQASTSREIAVPKQKVWNSTSQFSTLFPQKNNKCVSCTTLHSPPNKNLKKMKPLLSRATQA